MSVLEQQGQARPVWAARLRQERQARSWSQARTARELQARTPHTLTSEENLVRNLKRWEAGTCEPTGFFQELLAHTFDTEPAALFPADTASAALSRTLAGEVTRGLLDSERAAIAAQVQELRALVEQMSQTTRARLDHVAQSIGLTTDLTTSTTTNLTTNLTVDVTADATGHDPGAPADAYDDTAGLTAVLTQSPDAAEDSDADGWD